MANNITAYNPMTNTATGIGGSWPQLNGLYDSLKHQLAVERDESYTLTDPKQLDEKQLDTVRKVLECRKPDNLTEQKALDALQIMKLLLMSTGMLTHTVTFRQRPVDNYGIGLQPVPPRQQMVGTMTMQTDRLKALLLGQQMAMGAQPTATSTSPPF